MKLVFVSGLAEIDRRTIVDLSLQRAGKKREFKVVDFDAISNLAEDMGNVTDLETARHLLSKFHTDVEKVMVSGLKGQGGDIIVNGYLTLVTGHGYISVMPEQFFRSFKPDSIVILEKENGKDTKDDEHQHINRYYGAMYSSLCGSLLKIIRFKEKRMMEAVEELSDLIKH